MPAIVYSSPDAGFWDTLLVLSFTDEREVPELPTDPFAAAHEAHPQPPEREAVRAKKAR